MFLIERICSKSYMYRILRMRIQFNYIFTIGMTRDTDRGCSTLGIWRKEKWCA